MTDSSSSRGTEALLEAVIVALGHVEYRAGQSSTDLAAALREHGLPAALDAPLRAGGRAELLVTSPDRGGGGGAPGAGVAVLPVVHGATDALRARVRALAAHREIAAVVIASPRPRHCVLAGELGGVPVRVTLLAAAPGPPMQVSDRPTAQS